MSSISTNAWLSKVLFFTLFITSISLISVPNASAAAATSFEDLSTCADEYLDKLPVENRVQKCIFAGTELLFVNKFPKAKIAANISIYFENKIISETSSDSLSIAFDKPGQYKFVVEASDKSLKSRTLVSENFYVLDPPVIVSNSKVATAGSIPEQKQSYLLTYSDSSIIRILESDYGFVPLTTSSMDVKSTKERNILSLPKSSKRIALGTTRVSLTPSQAALLKSDKRVLAVEKNEIVIIEATQSSPPWNLDRIDQASLPLNNSFTYPAPTFVPTVYVLDSGLRYYHEEFTGRVEDCMYFTSIATTCDDYYGHGTHVTGTVAGTKSGAAKNANIKFLRLTGNSGSSTSSYYIYEGFSWAIDDHTSSDPNHQAVLNLSYGGSSASYTTQTWMSAMTDANIIPVVSAGNDSANACYYNFGFAGQDPYNLGISVGATTYSSNTDTLAYFSNEGECVSIYAPGMNIVSASYGGSSSYSTMSGTSMASPLVAGALAKFISVHPSATRVDVIDWLYATSRKDIVYGLDGSSNNYFLSLIPSIFTPSLVIANPSETISANEVIVLDVENEYGGPITYSVTGSGCSISGSTLSVNKPTTCAVVANKAALGYFAKLTSEAVSFTFTGSDQETLTISNVTKSGPAGTAITLTTTGGSGAGAVTYTTTGTGCSISTASLSASTATTCVVTATKAANGIYSARSSDAVSFIFSAGIPVKEIFGRPYQNSVSTWYIPYTNSSTEIAPVFTELQVKLVADPETSWTSISFSRNCGAYGCGAIVKGYTTVCPQFRFTNFISGLLSAIWTKSASSGGTCP